MKLKKIITILGIMLLVTVLSSTTITALDKTQNETIDMYNIKFTAPKTDNYTITNVKGVNGAWTYTYEDKKNEITIYISDKVMPEYKMGQEGFDEYIGYYNQVIIKDKYVVVASKFSENKDFILPTLYDLNPIS